MPPVATFSHSGPRIDHTPAAAVGAGDVVLLNDLIAIASLDIPAARQGALSVEGIYDVLKGAQAFAAGQRVYFDMTNKIASDDPSVGPLLGKAVRARVSGDATVRVLVDPSQASDLLAAIMAAGTALTNSNVATALGTITIPANRLQVGDVIRFRAQGIATATNSTDTLTAAILLNSQSVVSTAAVDVSNNDIFFLEGDIVVRTIGANGTIVACGTQGLGTPGTVTAKPWFLPSAVIDTTVAQALKVMGTWSVANAGDSCRLDVFNAELLRQR